MRDKRAVHTGVMAQLAAACDGPSDCLAFLSQQRASVGSTHGWHERTDRRFVGDGDDSDMQGKGRQAGEVLISHMDVLNFNGQRRKRWLDNVEINVMSKSASTESTFKLPYNFFI